MELSEAPLMDEKDWSHVRMLLGIPYGWTLRAVHRFDGGRLGDYWVLTASGPRGLTYRTGALACGHRTMQVSATELPVAVAAMAARYRFHQRDCS